MTTSEFIKTALCRVYQGVASVPEILIPEKERAMLKGTGSIRKLPVYLSKNGIDNVLLIADRAIAGSEHTKGLTAKLDELKIKYRLITAGENATALTAEKCVEEYAVGNCKAIIALGGGTAIDCAKLAAIKIGRGKTDFSGFKGRKIILSHLPRILAVPTTVGSGSENSGTAVCFDKKQKTKNVVLTGKIKPYAAVLDPQLTASLSPELLAKTAMSVLCRATETYICKNTSKERREKAELAVRLVFSNIIKAYENNDSDAKAELQKASYLSGSNAGYAHHGALAVSGCCKVSYSQASAVLLPAVMRAYGDKAYKRLAELAQAVKIKGETEKEKAENFILAVESIAKKLLVPAKLKELKKSSIPKCAKAISEYCNPYYAAPKQLFYEDISRILQKVKG